LAGGCSPDPRPLPRAPSPQTSRSTASPFPSLRLSQGYHNRQLSRVFCSPTGVRVRGCLLPIPPGGVSIQPPCLSRGPSPQVVVLSGSCSQAACLPSRPGRPGLISRVSSTSSRGCSLQGRSSWGFPSSKAQGPIGFTGLSV
jgi:hypothetical protein